MAAVEGGRRSGRNGTAFKMLRRGRSTYYRRHRPRLFDERVVRREVTGAGGMTGVTAG
jgi:hypothetical protein